MLARAGAPGKSRLGASGARPRRGSRAIRGSPGRSAWPRPRPAIRKVRSTHAAPVDLERDERAVRERMEHAALADDRGGAAPDVDLHVLRAGCPATTRAPIGAFDTEASRTPGAISTHGLALVAARDDAAGEQVRSCRPAAPPAGVAGRRSTCSRGPSCTSRPSISTAMRSASSSAWPRSWLTRPTRRAGVADRRAQVERERFARRDVEIVEGLVEQQHARLAHEGLGERHPAHLAAGERRRGALGERLEPEARQRRARAARGLARAGCPRPRAARAR